MRVRKKQYLILAILISSLFFLIILSKNFIYEEDNKVYRISVIIRGKNSESWMITKEGIDQAALDMNVDISFITLSEENNLEEQEKLIKREIDDGVDALIIAPVDSEKMSNAIKSAKEKVPVVLIDSTIQGMKQIPYVSCDNYLLGKSLADEVIRSGNYRKNIAIINSDTSYSSIGDRYRGFEEVIKESKNKYELWDISGDTINGTEYIPKMVKEKNIDILVALEPSTLEVLAQAKKELILGYEEANNIEIYGVGSTSKIIALLEEHVINSIIVQNEFNVGYLCVQAAVDLIKGEKINNKNIDFSVISNINMYSDENQRLLFPFVR
ncbi:substrate-binding domain-containing protein [Clostridium sp. NSJ-6]|uniref:Substrate-binding domain-containing protein n=1 Tax=Clostridium hominis TaxID=2763036 RepID=A0ABR7DI98_9CLOT|nr:substrate-binding domain-containing protein [Clostridium hominis]MBC5631116.1 substrate-binding domain-containing protein [Clostridium hominis]MDU2671197.1 substrate-binding domain-containing protein [Clostridium sp.]